MADIKVSKELLDTLEKFLQDELVCSVSRNTKDTIDPNDPYISFECSGCDNPYGEDWYEVYDIWLGKDELGYDEESLNDIIITKFAEECERRYEYFDVNEDVRVWAESAGENGVPDFRELVENAEFKDKTLEEVACAANKMKTTWWRRFAGYED